MQDWNQIMRRLSGVSGKVGMWWELVNHEWIVWTQDCSRVSLSLKEVFLSRIIIPWWSEPPGKTRLATKCLRTALSCATVVPHYVWCHNIILHSYKYYVTISTTAGNENGIGRSPDPFFPVWWKNGLGTRLVSGILIQYSLLEWDMLWRYVHIQFELAEVGLVMRPSQQ